MHGSLLQIRLLVETTSCSATPAELAAMLALTAGGLARRMHLLGSRSAVLRAEMLRTAASLFATLLLPQCRDGAAPSSLPGPANAGGTEEHSGAAVPVLPNGAGQTSAAAGAEAGAGAMPGGDAAVSRFAAAVRRCCSAALLAPLPRAHAGGADRAGQPNEAVAGPNPDAAHPMLSLFLKEAAHLLFGPLLPRVLSLHGAAAGAGAWHPISALLPGSVVLRCTGHIEGHLVWKQQWLWNTELSRCGPRYWALRLLVCRADGSSGSAQAGLQAAEVAAALAHPIYDVRAALLKALLERFPGAPTRLRLQTCCTTTWQVLSVMYSRWLRRLMAPACAAPESMFRL